METLGNILKQLTFGLSTKQEDLFQKSQFWCERCPNLYLYFFVSAFKGNLYGYRRLLDLRIAAPTIEPNSQMLSF